MSDRVQAAWEEEEHICSLPVTKSIRVGICQQTTSSVYAKPFSNTNANVECQSHMSRYPNDCQRL